MKKKVFLNGRFLTQRITGVQRTAYELVTALDILLDKNVVDKNKFEYILIYSGEIKTPIHLRHIRLVKKGFLKGNLWEQLELPFYTIGSLLVSMCTISSLLKRKQLVIVHDASFLVNPAFFSFTFRVWYKFAIPALSKIALHIITVSNFSKKELVQYATFNEEKISVIYNSADHIKRFEDAGETFKNKISQLKPYCLAVSSLSANKNFKGLSDAISKTDFSDFKMLVAGGASGSLQHSAPNDFVIYLGYVTNAELKFLYKNASLFLFPSFYEGFGIPPLEAMSSGCPVAASNTSSLPEVLGDACEYFDPYDSDDIATKVHHLLNDNSRLDFLRQKGYERASLFRWERSALQLHALVNEYG